jgi:hypothetical protein
MNWKKFLLIGLAVSAFAFAAAPRAEAGVSVGIGIGLPIGIGYYGSGYPGYYPYGYPYGYRYYGPRRVAYVAPPYYWSHGRRVYYRHRHWR